MTCASAHLILFPAASQFGPVCSVFLYVFFSGCWTLLSVVPVMSQISPLPALLTHQHLFGGSCTPLAEPFFSFSGLLSPLALLFFWGPVGHSVSSSVHLPVKSCTLTLQRPLKPWAPLWEVPSKDKGPTATTHACVHTSINTNTHKSQIHITVTFITPLCVTFIYVYPYKQPISLSSTVPPPQSLNLFWVTCHIPVS